MNAHPVQTNSSLSARSYFSCPLFNSTSITRDTGITYFKMIEVQTLYVRIIKYTCTCKINYFNFYFLDFPIKCYNSVLYLHLLIENTRLGTYWKHEFKSWYSNAMSQKAWGPLSHMVDPKGWIRFQRYPSKRT